MTAPYFDGTQPCAQTDPELFFPEKGGSVREARRVCRGCEFAAACLEYALTNDVVGVWGGTSEQQRRHIQRHRTRGPQPIKHGTEGGAPAARREGVRLLRPGQPPRSQAPRGACRMNAGNRTPLPCQTGNPDRFFPPSGHSPQSAEKVKAECEPCPLLEPCKNWAIHYGEIGIWGGTTAPERNAIRRRRGIRPQHITIDVVAETHAARIRTLVARGLTPAEIAHTLGMSVSGADNAARRIRGKAS